MKVPLLDLKAQYQPIRKEIMAALESACDDQAFILGSRVADLEKDIQGYVGAGHAVGVASGSDALLLALMAAGVGPGDEVVTVPYTFFATAGSISRLGARPVFVDIKADTFNLDPSLLEAAMTAKTKAIMPVHLYGQCAEMEPILRTAAARKVPVIEDAAQAIGAAWRGRHAARSDRSAASVFSPRRTWAGSGTAAWSSRTSRRWPTASACCVSTGAA